MKHIFQLLLALLLLPAMSQAQDLSTLQRLGHNSDSQEILIAKAKKKASKKGGKATKSSGKKKGGKSAGKNSRKGKGSKATKGSKKGRSRRSSGTSSRKSSRPARPRVNVNTTGWYQSVPGETPDYAVAVVDRDGEWHVTCAKIKDFGWIEGEFEYEKRTGHFNGYIDPRTRNYYTIELSFVDNRDSQTQKALQAEIKISNPSWDYMIPVRVIVQKESSDPSMRCR